MVQQTEKPITTTTATRMHTKIAYHTTFKTETQSHKDAFSLFDVDGDGKISEKELQDVMKRMGHTVTSHEVKVMIEEASSYHLNFLTYNDFCKIIENRIDQHSQSGTNLTKENITSIDINIPDFWKSDIEAPKNTPTSTAHPKAKRSSFLSRVKNIFTPTSASKKAPPSPTNKVHVSAQNTQVKKPKEEPQKYSFEEDMQLAFSAFDVNSDGYVSFKEIKSLVNDLGIGVAFSDEEIYELLAMVGVKPASNAVISFQDFCHIFQQCK